MFEKCEEISRWLSAFDRPWMFAGGWALDLHIGEETRHHDDVEVVIFREDQRKLYRFLYAWDLQIVERGSDRRWEGERLEQPIHEIHAFSQEGDLLEIFLHDKKGEHWHYRRDPGITYDSNHMQLRSEQGYPYLNPEIVLLYKSEDTRKKDDQDFLHVFPYLNEHRKEWLKQGLMHHQPNHPWLERLLY